MKIRKVHLLHLCTFILLHLFNLPLYAEDHFRLVITGDMMGAINECDCPGGQPGGLARRKSILDAIRAESPDAVFIDCGKLFDNVMSQTELALVWDLLKLLEYDLVSGTEYDNIILEDRDKTSASYKANYYKDQTLSLFDHKLNIAALINDGSDVLDWKISTTLTGLSIILLNEDNIDDLSFLIESDIESISQLDIIIFYGSGYIEANVELYPISLGKSEKLKNAKKILLARPSMYGEYVLVLDLWTEDGNKISRFEWESIATESYPPDSTFQAKIDLIYKDKIDSRDK